MKSGECRPVKNHHRIEPANQVDQFIKPEKQTRVAKNLGLNIDQRRLSVEVADDMLIAVEWKVNRFRDDARKDPETRQTTGPGARLRRSMSGRSFGRSSDGIPGIRPSCFSSKQSESTHFR